MLKSSVEASLGSFVHRVAKRKRKDKPTFDTWKNELLPSYLPQSPPNFPW